MNPIPSTPSESRKTELKLVSKVEAEIQADTEQMRVNKASLNTPQTQKNFTEHIVETLIRERAPKLTRRPKLFKIVRPILYRMLAYDAAVFLADNIRYMSGHAAFDMITNHIRPSVRVTGWENVPATGRCIVMANHPTGLADGMAVFKALRQRRPEHIFLANADALRVMENGQDIIIPVEWVKDKRSVAKARQTLLDVKAALNAEKCVVIFPSGRLAQLGITGLKEQAWESSAAMLARKYKAPIVPLRIRARNSLLYYLFSRLNNELRDITLFHELLNKKERRFDLRFGQPVAPETLAKNAEDATQFVRERVEDL